MIKVEKRNDVSPSIYFLTPILAIFLTLIGGAIIFYVLRFNPIEALKFFFITKNSNKRFIKVSSAFGGLAIYKINRIMEFKYNSDEGINCEHVKFNENINKKYGGLFIDKQLINSNGINKHTIAGILASKIIFFSKRFFSNLKKI